jgi:hypothetical protein
MPSRILRDSYATSESVAGMEPGAQDRLPRYFLLADDFGCFQVNEAVIAGRIFPLRPDMTPQRIAADLGEFQRAGVLVVWTTEDGKRYAEFPNWFKHQREPRAGTKRKTPQRPAENRSGPQETAGNGKNPPSQSQSQSQASSGEKRTSPIPTKGERQRARFPHATALLDLLADDFPDTAPIANDAQLAALDREAQRRGGAAALAEACVAFIDAKGGRAPGTVAYFASVIPDLPTARDIAARTPARKPGENPKPGDPDFNDQDAWSDYDAFLARDAGSPHAA